MPLPDLSSFDTRLDRICADVLGEEILYKPAGSDDYLTVRAHVNYRDMAQAFSGSEAIAQDITVAIVKADLPEKPGRDTRIQLPKVVGRTFKPAAVRSDESGTHWEFEVKDVPA